MFKDPKKFKKPLRGSRDSAVDIGESQSSVGSVESGKGAGEGD